MIALAKRVPWRLALIAVVLAGWLGAELGGLDDISKSSSYLYATSLLLAIGLYGATFGIELDEAREHRRLILTAVTVGVLLKAAIIGGALYLATRDPLFLLLGVAVAQIDPLSVAAILDDERMSPRAKTILASWASFDDPLTVILVVYASALATDAFGLQNAAGTQTGSVAGGLLAYGVTLLANLVFAGVAVLLWRKLRDRWPVAVAACLGILLVLAVWQFLMLGVAIAGLFIRPAWLGRYVTQITQYALFVAAALLGLLLVGGVNLADGILLGLMAFLAQVVVGVLLTRRLNRTDRTHLALAQQNGITAIILGLRLETQYTGAVAAIAPAILVTNLTYFAANWLADRAERYWRPATPPADASTPAAVPDGPGASM